MRESSYTTERRRSINWSVRERKISSVAGEANSTAELPEHSPYWKLNLVKQSYADTPESQCSCSFRDFSESTN